jgi:hypothetical protein
MQIYRTWFFKDISEHTYSIGDLFMLDEVILPDDPLFTFRLVLDRMKVTHIMICYELITWCS